jgi:hypothetical protein
LGDLGARALSAFDFAREDGDRAVFGDVQASAEGDWTAAPAAEAGSPRALFLGRLSLRDATARCCADENPRAQNLHERSPAQSKIVFHRLDDLIRVVGDLELQI